jgi:hypothetical protein
VAILAEARTASQDDLDRLAGEARDLVQVGSRSPRTWPADVTAAYQRLGADIRVAVRSSGIGEDAEGHLVRRHERDLHQRRRNDAASWPASWTAGPRCGALAPSSTGATRI